MGWFRSLRNGLRALIHREQLNQELDEELEGYLHSASEALMRGGMPPEEAWRAARVEMGSMEAVKQGVRSAGWESVVETLWLDLRYSLRMLRKSPSFTAIAVLSLGLGVGANTAIFTLIHDLLLKSLPVHQPEQLVSFGQAGGGGIAGALSMGTGGLFAYDFHRQVEKQHEFFQGICASASFTLPAGMRFGDDSTNPARTAFFQMVSGNYFSVLGVAPILGRSILDSDEDAPGRSAVAVLSHHYWLTTMAGDPSVIGRSITLDGLPFTVIGVAPPKFYGEKVEEQAPDLWLPLTMQEQVMQHSSLLAPRDIYWLHLMGRQNVGMNTSAAQAWFNNQVQGYMSELEGSHLTAARKAEIQRIFVPLLPGGRGVSGLRQQYTEPLNILMGVVVLVLLIACANLASFLLAKVASREREISTRLALGSSRARIVVQILIETLLVSILGGALGLLFAYWGTRALIRFVVQGATYTVLDPKPDLAVLAFTFGISLVTAVLFGLAPALRVSRTRVTPALKANPRTATGSASASSRLVPKSLVVAQVMLTLMLLMGAGLFLRTLSNLENQDLGFSHRNLLMIQFLPEAAGYKPAQLTGLYDRLLERAQALPAVRSATLSNTPVVSPANWGSPISIQGSAPQPNEDLETLGNFVAPRYFETVGIPVLLGRSIGPQDTAASHRVVVVNQTFANRFFPHRDVIGRSFTIADPGVPGTWEIVGVVRNAMYAGPREGPEPMIYLPVTQISGPHAYAHWLLLDTIGDPSQLSEEVRRTLGLVDANLLILKTETIVEQVDHLTDHEQLLSQLCAVFALVALLLASIGLYGVMTYSVVRRTNEIGVRMALGAQNRQVVWMVLKESLLLFAVGIVLGIPLALGTARMIRSQFFDVNPFDPLTLVTAVLLIGIVILTATSFPARRAAKVDPIVALRYE
jgi:predicted permease